MSKPGRKARIKARIHERKMATARRVAEAEAIKRTLPADSNPKVNVEFISVPVRLPVVLNEWKTLELVLNGCSLSRYGDGEVKHMEGKRNVSQECSASLSRAMRAVFSSRIRNHLVAIPNVYGDRAFTDVHEGYIASMQKRFWRIADPHYTYGSAYISRGDLCGYLSWPSYWAVMSSLWSNRDVVLVRGVEKRANPPGMLSGARNLARVHTPSQDAWAEYDRIFKECLSHPKESLFLLCVGPTATVLAADLAKQGRWAVDIGHLGMFYRQWGRKVDV